MPTSSDRSFVLARTLLALCAASPLTLAQTAPAPRMDVASQEAIQISPFEVTSDKDVGYLAANTLAGSRFNTPLKDTAAAISVFTPEFLSDIGAFNLTEAMNYAVNVERQLDDDRPAVNGNETISGYQSFRVRGMTASTARNYFVWNLPPEVSLVERIEDSRGPNAVLFGIASPGGLINANTKQPLAGRAFRKGSFTVGDHDSWRGTIDINQPLLRDALALRLNLVDEKNNGFRHHAFENHQRGHLAASYRLSESTRIRAEYEHGQIDSNQPKTFTLTDRFLLWNGMGRPTFASVPSTAMRTANGIIQNATAAAQPRVTYIANSDLLVAMNGTLATSGTGNVITDTRMADYSVNVGGPGQDRSSRFNALSAFLEHTFSRTTFLELAYNHQDHIFDRYDARAGEVNGLNGDPQQLLPTGAPNPYAGKLFIESSWTRLLLRENTDTGRAMLSHELDAKKWGNYRFALLGQYDKGFTSGLTANEMWTDAATGLAAFNPTTPENAANNVWRRNYVTERDWGSYYVQGPGPGSSITSRRDPITGRTLTARFIPATSGASPSETYTTTKTLMIAAQARYFDGRVVLAGGIRRDDLDEFNVAHRRDPVTQEWMIARNPADADPTALATSNNNVGRTKTAGIVVHPIPRLSLFYNWSDNVALPARGATTMPADGTPGNPVAVPSPHGNGQDVGFALDLFDGKVSARATYYETKGEQQSTTFSAPTRNANTRILDALQTASIISKAEHDLRNTVGGQGLFDWTSQGVELQLTGNVTRNWRLMANYSITDGNETNKFVEWWAWEAQNRAYLAALQAKTPETNIYNVMTSTRSIRDELDFIVNGDNALGAQTAAAGKGKLGNRRDKVSLFTRYNVSQGWLKGVFVGGGYRHQSKMFVGLDPRGEKLYGNSFWYADALLGYNVRGLRNGRGLSFQLNVMNVFDRQRPLVTRYDASGAIFRNVVQPPTTWRFTTNIEF